MVDKHSTHWAILPDKTPFFLKQVGWTKHNLLQYGHAKYLENPFVWNNINTRIFNEKW